MPPATEHAILSALDAALHRDGVRPLIDTVAARVEAELAHDAPALFAWEPVPLAAYGGGLPEGIRSSWVFVLRAGTTSGAERHPNSHQRVVSYRGEADLQTWRDGRWKSHRLTSASRAPLGKRWLSIPPNIWHKPVMGRENWVVVSFHTAPAEELIEERGDPAGEGRTRRRTYIT
jgi:hypothetical protein